jgi:hypothetical protein
VRKKSQGKKRALLQELLKELSFLEAGGFSAGGLPLSLEGPLLEKGPAGRSALVLRNGPAFVFLNGPVFFPQTPHSILAKKLAASPPEGWGGVLANEILLYLKRAFDLGHAEAAPDALDFCRHTRLAVPHWALMPRPKRPGSRALEKRKSFRKDLIRNLAIHLAANNISDERASGPPRDLRAGRTGERDRYVRAKEYVAGSWVDTHTSESDKAIRASFARFTRKHDSYYVTPHELLRLILRDSAPIVFQLLTTPFSQ